MATLIIDPWNSVCGVCRKGATWREETHDTVLGYFAKDHVPEPGCGARWTHVGTSYGGGEFEAAARECRPDLEWAGSVI